MQRPSKLRLTEVSPHLICALCGGYLIDATTIVECLHSFCKTCIVRYLESSKYCPICEVLVHKTRPLQNIRLDHTLQDIVYKLVPSLFKDEMRRRRDYYKDSPTIRSAEVRQQQQRHRVIFSSDEMFSVSLEFCPDGRIHQPVVKRGRKKSTKSQDRRYLLCPAGTTMIHLKKFIRLKFALSESYQVDLFHAKGNLRDNYSLMDVAYIYSWKRMSNGASYQILTGSHQAFIDETYEGVFQLYYSIFKEPVKIPQITITEVKDELCLPETSKQPSTFSASSLLGNKCCDSDLPHDLSPLELIATVANGLSSLPDGRGQKRSADTAELYDDDTHGSTEIQIQKSIEHAIEMCSNNNHENKYSIEMEEIAKVQNSDEKHLIVVKLEDNKSSVTCDDKSTIKSGQNECLVNKGKLNDSKPVVQNEKPKKTDTASQCEPRQRKGDMKNTNNNSIHSKSFSKTKHAKVQNTTDQSAKADTCTTPIKDTKVHNAGAINVTNDKDTSSIKNTKDSSVTITRKEELNNMCTPELDKKNKVNHNVKVSDKNVSDKTVKASPQKQEKTVGAQKMEKVSNVRKLTEPIEAKIGQKNVVPKMNGICSASELDKDTMPMAKPNT